MIILDIQEYCHDCRDFEADVDKPERQTVGDTVVQTDTIIRCERRNRCASIKRYLELQAKFKADQEAVQNALNTHWSEELGGKFTNRCRDI